MADLTTNFLGISSPNPFWLASAPPTDKEYNVRRAFEEPDLHVPAAGSDVQAILGRDQAAERRAWDRAGCGGGAHELGVELPSRR